MLPRQSSVDRRPFLNQSALGGIALGVIGSVAARKLVAAQLFGVGPTDVVTLTLAAAVLAMIAVLACVVPMRRAAHADPLEALPAR